jgi:hypothetical protein
MAYRGTSPHRAPRIEVVAIIATCSTRSPPPPVSLFPSSLFSLLSLSLLSPPYPTPSTLAFSCSTAVHCALAERPATVAQLPTVGAPRHHHSVSPSPRSLSAPLITKRHHCHRPDSTGALLPLLLSSSFSLPLLSCSLTTEWGRGGVDTHRTQPKSSPTTSLHPMGVGHATSWDPLGSHCTPLPSLPFLRGLGPHRLQRGESWCTDLCMA